MNRDGFLSIFSTVLFKYIMPGPAGNVKGTQDLRSYFLLSRLSDSIGSDRNG